MSEAPNRQAVIVGLFVALSVLILAGGILTIGSINDSFSSKIRVSAVFPEVNGLQVGNNVWFSGVKVGTVKKVGFHGGREVQVDMAIDEEASPFIRSDALAKISSDGLIGNKIVVIYEGTDQAPPLVEGTTLAAGSAVSTEEMMAMFQENNKNLLEITTNLKGVTTKIASGEGTVGKLLTDDDLYRNVTTTVASLQDASVNAQVLTSSLSTFASKMNQEGSLPNSLVTDRETYASLTTSVGKLEEVADNAAAMVAGLEQGTQDPDSPIGTLLHDEEAGGDLKQVLENLNTGTVLLSDNLEAMQHNILLRGFFKKKEKEQARIREEEAAMHQVPTTN